MARIGKNQLIQLQKKYHTDHAIAKLYGLSRQAVHQLRKRYGIATIKNRHKARNKQIFTLFSQGIPVLKLAKKYKLSAIQIYRIIKKQSLDSM